MNLRPFHPDRETEGLFNLIHDPEASPPAETMRELAIARRPYGLTGDELAAFFDDLFERPDLTLDDLYPFTVRTGWRLVRAMARVRGAIGQDEPLELAGTRLPGAWDEPWTVMQTADTRDRLVRALVTTKSPLLPPAPPVEWTNGDKDPSYYSAASDAPLCDYVNALGVLARRLGIPNRKEGRLGLRPILDIHTTRVAMPSARELIACERIMVEAMVEAIDERGHIGGAKKMRDEYGLHESEIGDLVLLARHAVVGVQSGMDVAMKRAMMEARLEGLAARARASLDVRGELMALKELSSVQGLKVVDPEGDDLDDMIDVVDEVSGADEPDAPELLE